jgi:UrcA family protein
MSSGRRRRSISNRRFHLLTDVAKRFIHYRCRSIFFNHHLGKRFMNTSIFFRPSASVRLFGSTFIASAMALAFYTATASADDASQRTIRVRYDDVNLSSASGVNRLKHRIMSAAKQVCGNDDERELLRSSSYQRCVAEATERALATVGVAPDESQPHLP